MKVCPNCGHRNEEESGYCLQCGEALPEPDVIATAEARAEAEPFLDTPVPALENDSPFNKQTLRHYYGYTKIAGFLMLAAALLFLAFSTVDAVINKEADPILFFLGAFIALGGGVYLWLYHQRTALNKTVTDTSRQLYLFKEDGLQTIFSDEGKKLSEILLSYDKITKVTAQKEHILLWFGNTVFLVERNSFTRGTEEDVVALLREKCNPGVVKIKAKK